MHIHHIAGSTNTAVDALSHYHLTDTRLNNDAITVLPESLWTNSIIIDKITQAQNTDVFANIDHHDSPHLASLSCRDGVLFFADHLYVPPPLHSHLLHDLHDASTAGHPCCVCSNNVTGGQASPLLSTSFFKAAFYVNRWSPSDASSCCPASAFWPLPIDPLALSRWTMSQDYPCLMDLMPFLS